MAKNLQTFQSGIDALCDITTSKIYINVQISWQMEQVNDSKNGLWTTSRQLLQLENLSKVVFK